MNYYINKNDEALMIMKMSHAVVQNMTMIKSMCHELIVVFGEVYNLQVRI